MSDYADTALVMELATKDQSHVQQIIALRNGIVFRRAFEGDVVRTRWRGTTTRSSVTEWLEGYLNLSTHAPQPMTRIRGTLVVGVTADEVAQAHRSIDRVPRTLAERATKALDSVADTPIDDVDVTGLIGTWAANPLRSVPEAPDVADLERRITADVLRDLNVQRVAEQQAWMESCGGGFSGYVERYGHSTDPDHYGDGAEAIFAADQAALDRATDAALAAIRKAREVREAGR